MAFRRLYDELSGQFTHHVHSANESYQAGLDRLQDVGYNDIRWNGGFDFSVCRYNEEAGTDGMTTNPAVNYETYDDQ